MKNRTWTEEDLVERSTNLIDYASVLGTNFPASIIENVERSIVEELRLRDRRMGDLEKEAHEKAQRAARIEAKRTVLQTIGAALPKDLGVLTVEENQFTGPFLKGQDFSIELEAGLIPGRLYAKSENSKLVVFVNGEKRRFPRKGDGTFSLDRAAEFIRENLRASATRRMAQDRRQAELDRFNAIVKPYKTVQAYETQASFIVSQNENETVSVFVQRCSNIEDRFVVSRTIVTTQTVTTEELKAILAAEVDEVARG